MKTSFSKVEKKWPEFHKSLSLAIASLVECFEFNRIIFQECKNMSYFLQDKIVLSKTCQNIDGKSLTYQYSYMTFIQSNS